MGGLGLGGVGGRGTLLLLNSLWTTTSDTSTIFYNEHIDCDKLSLYYDMQVYYPMP